MAHIIDGRKNCKSLEKRSSRKKTLLYNHLDIAYISRSRDLNIYNIFKYLNTPSRSVSFWSSMANMSKYIPRIFLIEQSSETSFYSPYDKSHKERLIEIYRGFREVVLFSRRIFPQVLHILARSPAELAMMRSSRFPTPCRFSTIRMRL